MNDLAAPADPAAADTAAPIEAAMSVILQRQERGETLAPAEQACVNALAVLTTAEAEARASFSAFYATLAAGGAATDAAPGSTALPAGVSETVGRWVASRKRWEDTVLAWLREHDARAPAAQPQRTGPRPAASLFASPTLRVPTAAPARDALLALLSPHLWHVDAAGEAITAEPGAGGTQVRIECDDDIGFGPERAIQQITKNGASAAQTFLTMAGFWLEQAQGQPHETYVTAYASDLLRYQKRKETPRGGYHSQDILAKGRDVYLLSRISLPRASQVTHENGARVTRTLRITRLLSLESLDAQQTFSAATNTGEQAPAGAVASPPRTLVTFRYHLGRDVYDWITGDRPQYAQVSKKLLGYHPVRQKYQILLGFCLAYYDRVNRKDTQSSERRIRLPALLNLAAIAVPDKRIAEFFSSIEDALSELAHDNVVPGLRLIKPDGWTDLLARRKTRDIIAGSVVTFPRLPGASAAALAAPNEGRQGDESRKTG